MSVGVRLAQMKKVFLIGRDKFSSVGASLVETVSAEFATGRH